MVANACAFLLHTRPRVQRASGIPCALCCFEGGSLPTTRASRAARTRTSVGVLFAAHPSRRPPTAGSSSGRHCVARRQILMVRNAAPPRLSNHEGPGSRTRFGCSKTESGSIAGTTLSTSFGATTGRAGARAVLSFLRISPVRYSSVKGRRAGRQQQGGHIVSEFRIAIVGFGKIARTQHVPAIAATQGATLVAIADPNAAPVGVPHFAA